MEESRISGESPLTTVVYTPLPPPGELERYEVIYPGVTKLLLDEARKESTHRREIDKADRRRANWGLGAGFILALAFLIAATIIILNGHGLEGSILGGIDLLGLVAAFLRETGPRRQP